MEVPKCQNNTERKLSTFFFFVLFFLSWLSWLIWIIFARPKVFFCKLMSQMLFLAKFPRLPSNWWQLFFRSKKTLVVNHLLLGDKNWSDYSFSLFEDLERWWLYRLYNWNIPYHFSCRKVMQYAWWCIDKFQSSSWLFTYRREEQNRSSLYSHHEGEKHISYRSHFLTRFFFNLPWSHSDPEFMIKAA